MKKFLKSFIAVFVIFVLSLFFIHFINISPDTKAFTFSNFNNAPSQKRTCGTMDRLQMTLKENPGYRDVLNNLEKYTEEYKKTHNYNNINSPVTIPVVVHVVYHTPGENISFDQIKSQMDVITNDFRRWNSDSILTPSCFKPVSADPQVMFILAKRDPNNNPSIGVTRTYTDVLTFGLDDAVKFTSMGGEDGWDRNRYLNLWACNLGDNLLGYAEFPGGPAATDGVVILYNAFGSVGNVQPPYDKGRTATHEIGHWLWLYHIWGDDNGACTGSDLVDDTPNQGAENYGCPGFPHISCNNGPNGDMYMNYMDYTDDGCMNIYTQGQTVRIWSALNGPRLPIQSSNGGVPVSGHPITEFYADSLTVHFGSSIHLFDASAGIPTSWVWTITGPANYSSTVQNPVIPVTTAGYYNVKLKATNSYGSDSLTKTTYIKVLGPTMNSFSLISPPMWTRILVSPTNQSLQDFIWNKTSTNSLITYNFGIRRVGPYSEYYYQSNNSGHDSVVSFRKSFLDTLAATMGTTGDSVECVWRVWAYNTLDSISSNSFIVTLVRVPIGMHKISSDIPVVYQLYSNYPNPFNPSTTIKFDLPKTQNVKLIIYDLAGRQVEILSDENFQAGSYQVNWNASNYASGVYFYRFITSEFSETKKMVLVK